MSPEDFAALDESAKRAVLLAALRKLVETDPTAQPIAHGWAIEEARQILAAAESK
jgi:hypothetical protein